MRGVTEPPRARLRARTGERPRARAALPGRGAACGRSEGLPPPGRRAARGGAGLPGAAAALPRARARAPGRPAHARGREGGRERAPVAAGGAGGQPRGGRPRAWWRRRRRGRPSRGGAGREGGAAPGSESRISRPQLRARSL